MVNWIEKFKGLISSSKSIIILEDLALLMDFIELRNIIKKEGYQVYEIKDNLELRILVELQIRNKTGKYLIFANSKIDPLPDILQICSYVNLGLKDLFPQLDTKAIKGLSFNALSLLSNIKHYEQLGYDKTIKFLLENLYNIDFDTLTKNKAKERILNALITVFLEKNGVNDSIIKYLTEISKPYFPSLIQQGLSKEKIIAFLQEEWEKFVIKNEKNIDFEDSILNKHYGFLIVYKYFKPIKVSLEKYNQIPNSLKIGVYYDEIEKDDTELEAQIQYLENQELAIEDQYEQWFNLANIVADAKLKVLSSTNQNLKEKFQKFDSTFNDRFQIFVDNSYNSLFTLSGIRRPVTVTRILDHIKAQPDSKKALFVIDGLNFWQWKIIEKLLLQENMQYSSNATLAFIPTITAWSRQAIFKGDKPDILKDNSDEKKLFENYWIENGYRKYQIAFEYIGIGHPYNYNLNNDTNIIGIVCNDIDTIMHGSKLGSMQLKASTELWVQQFNLVNIIKSLRDSGFTVFLTSDHGSVEAKGIKNLRLIDKVGVLSRGKRYLQFSNETMFDSFKANNENIKFGKINNSIYLRHNEAFTNENETIITHGGSNYLEVIVPFITIR